VTTRSAIAVNFRGKEYVGEYEIAGRTLRVFYQGETKMGIMRGSDAEFATRILFIELVSRIESSTVKPLKKL
jgi:hypothetical protein